MDQAAKRRGYSQPAVSYQIQRLERALGARLFGRYCTGAGLTREGRMILPSARAMLTLFESIKSVAGVRARRVAGLRPCGHGLRRTRRPRPGHASPAPPGRVPATPAEGTRPGNGPERATLTQDQLLLAPRDLRCGRIRRTYSNRRQDRVERQDRERQASSHRDRCGLRHRGGDRPPAP
ncbi:LysR family transcriptional regulator [Streptomyces sp. Edi4]|uniref:LysR family transcriptional regulator n=1 Tax=Streptomyces sp. Edi4 TaxID=3162527 RepID=UPI0033061E9E